jgi:hypothetical protein
MVVDIDIWRAANMLLRDHGYDAPIIAAQRCHKFAQDGDLAGLRVWKRIMDAIEQLSRGRNDDERLGIDATAPNHCHRDRRRRSRQPWCEHLFVLPALPTLSRTHFVSSLQTGSI